MLLCVPKIHTETDFQYKTELSVIYQSSSHFARHACLFVCFKILNKQKEKTKRLAVQSNSIWK